MTVRLERDGDNITQTELSARVARDTSTLLRFAGYTAVGACIAGTIIGIGAW